MGNVPLGYAISTVFAAVFVLLGLRPRPTNGPRITPSFVLASVSSELHVLMVLLVVAPTALAALEGDLGSPVGLVALLLAMITLAWIARSVVLSSRTAGALESGLRAAFGPEFRVHHRLAPGEWMRVLLAPVWWRRRDVVRTKDIRYGPAPGRSNLLDLYRSRAQARPGPALVHLHGGGFSSGVKSREARLLLQRFASRGWVCVSADYRLRPAKFPDQVVDAKRVIAWLRTEGATYGVDPDAVVVVGGSAGAHLAMMCALTGGDERFQPGFEDVDTTVVAAVGLYGYYGQASGSRTSSPSAHLRPDAPPVMLVHGGRDPMVPVEDARGFANALRRQSRSAVVWGELPGALHTFDRFASVRSAAVAVAVEAFAERVLEERAVEASEGAPQDQEP